MPVLPSNGHRQAFAAGVANFLACKQGPVDTKAAIIKELDPVPMGLEGASGHLLIIA